jgi:hypothetical protein
VSRKAPELEGRRQTNLFNRSSRALIATVINGPATKALNVYDVHEVEGSIQIRA